MKRRKSPANPAPPGSGPEGQESVRASVPGSIEFKQALLKRCFSKMAIGAVLLSPLIMTQVQHKWGQAGSGLLLLLFFPLAAVMFVLACVDYAKSKGLHPAMGLLGLGSIFGLVVLSFWPDRYPYDRVAKRERKR